MSRGQKKTKNESLDVSGVHGILGALPQTTSLRLAHSWLGCLSPVSGLPDLGYAVMTLGAAKVQVTWASPPDVAGGMWELTQLSTRQK